MKKHSLALNKLGNKFYLITWLVFHLAVFAFFGIVFAVTHGGISVDSDLFNMFPKPFQEESIRKVDDKFTELTGQNVMMLACNEDFSKAKSAAEQAYAQLKDNHNFKSLTLYSDFGEIGDFSELLYKYRWNLLDEASIAAINEEGGAELFAENALIKAYSPFTMLPLDNLDMDPFMLEETEAGYYLSEIQKSVGELNIYEGVMAVQHNGLWYVMLRGILTPEGSAMGSKDNGVTDIYSVCEALETDGTRFVYSGTPFYSHRSSNNAISEIGIISAVSISVVVIILLFVFHSPVPVLSSLFSIGISILTGLLATFAVFREIHILTLIFATSLIGSCIDYSLHYFTHWAADGSLKNTSDIRNKLLPGLTMAIVSSSICYIILLFAPFNLLKQMALFCVVGLISSFITTIALYPYIPLPKKREVKALKLMKPASNPELKKKIGRWSITALFVFSIGTLLILNSRLRIVNDLNKLYEMDEDQLSDYNEVIDAIQYTPSGWIIVRGDSEEDVLVREASICAKIDKATDGKLGYVSASKFIPSIEKQLRSREACRKLLAYTEDQMEYLGFYAEDAEYVYEDFEASKNDFLSMSGGNVPEYLADLISTAWLGEMDGKYYTVILPNLIEDSALLKEIASGDDNVFYVDKMADMGEDLDKLTLLIFQFFAIAYVIMFVVLKFFYSWKQAAKIISVPVLIILITASIFVLLDMRLEFFSVTGLILVFGLGLDYIIYMMENENSTAHGDKVMEPFATLLSFFTTIVSFGALALSNFMPVHFMGLSIFIGLATAYISTMLYDRSL